jgi:hypothetical protein
VFLFGAEDAHVVWAISRSRHRHFFKRFTEFGVLIGLRAGVLEFQLPVNLPGLFRHLPAFYRHGLH